MAATVSRPGAPNSNLYGPANGTPIVIPSLDKA